MRQEVQVAGKVGVEVLAAGEVMGLRRRVEEQGRGVATRMPTKRGSRLCETDRFMRMMALDFDAVRLWHLMHGVLDDIGVM